MHVTAVDVAAYSDVLSDCYVATDADAGRRGGARGGPGPPRRAARAGVATSPRRSASARATSSRSNGAPGRRDPGRASTTDFAGTHRCARCCSRACCSPPTGSTPRPGCRWRTSSSGRRARTATSSCEPPGAAPGAGSDRGRRRHRRSSTSCRTSTSRTSTRRTTSTATSRTTTSGRPSSAGTPPSTTASPASASTPATPPRRACSTARPRCPPPCATSCSAVRADVVVVSYNDEAWISPERLDALAARGRARGRAGARLRQQEVRRRADRHPQARPASKVGRVSHLRNTELSSSPARRPGRGRSRRGLDDASPGSAAAAHRWRRNTSGRFVITPSTPARSTRRIAKRWSTVHVRQRMPLACTAST